MNKPITGPRDISRANVAAFVTETGEQFSHSYTHGITIREHFAGLAMQGMLANNLIPDLIKAQKIPHDQVPEWLALGAVEHADALIAELAKASS